MGCHNWTLETELWDGVFRVEETTRWWLMFWLVGEGMPRNDMARMDENRDLGRSRGPAE